MIFPQEFTAMDEPIADYNCLLPVAIAGAGYSRLSRIAWSVFGI
jgi:hypothetical protein